MSEKQIPYGAINEVMDNFISISLIMSTMPTNPDEFEQNSQDSKEQFMYQARRKLLEEQQKKEIIIPFFMGSLDFLCQQYDLQFMENYQELAHSMASDIFSRAFDINYEKASELATLGFELNATNAGFAMVKEGGESILAWLKGNMESSMRLSLLLAIE